MVRTLYDVLGVGPGASSDELRRAYRERARSLHPDHGLAAASGPAMAELNQAWTVLSRPERRRAYDRDTFPGRAPGAPKSGPPGGTGPAPGASRSPRQRREAWEAGMRMQIRRLGAEAARASAQALALRRRGGTRADYEAVVGALVDGLGADTSERLQEARARGAAPLDLGLAATLIGLREEAAALVRAVGDRGPTPTERHRAELIDRTFDTVAHELRHDLVAALGGKPHVGRILRA